MNLLIDIVRSIAGAIVAPPMLFILIMLIVALYMKNRKIAVMQKLILGDSVNSSIELTLSQVVLGVFAGILGSIIINSLGVVFDSNSGIIYLFIISIVLMMINPRFICFSYSSAVLGLISIFEKIISPYSSGFFSGLRNINIMYLMIFVGVLHIVEGLLVMIDGSRGAVPVFTNSDNKILGGYALKRYWVLPVCIMLITNGKEFSDYLLAIKQFPNWWPLIKESNFINIAELSALALVPFYGMIGYSSITFTRSKRQKAFVSGCYILSYGILLTLFSWIASIGIIGEVILIAAAPIGHEFMLKAQRINETNREAKFVSDDTGLTILDIVPGSELDKQGVKCGERVVSVNNQTIRNESEIYTILKKSLYQIDLCIINEKNNLRHVIIKHNKKKRLGLLLVPSSVKEDEIIEVKDKSFKNILDTIKEKDIEKNTAGRNSDKNKNK